jgi:hypothetical protein
MVSILIKYIFKQAFFSSWGYNYPSPQGIPERDPMCKGRGTAPGIPLQDLGFIDVVKKLLIIMSYLKLGFL